MAWWREDEDGDTKNSGPHRERWFVFPVSAVPSLPLALHTNNRRETNMQKNKSVARIQNQDEVY